MKTHALVALLVALIAAAPLTWPGPLQTHSGFTPLFALMGDMQATQSVGMLPLALAQMLARLGLAPLDALKSVDALAFGLGALGTFWLARHRYGNDAGLVASALYSLLPYRLMTTYVRGALGESLFLGLLPWVLFATLQITTKTQRHKDTKRKNLSVLVSWCLGVLIIAIFWKLCAPFAPDLSQAQVYLFQIFSARWDYGGRGDWLNAPPLQLGIAPVGLSVIALATKPDRGALKLAAIACVLCLLSIVPFSQWWPWPWLLSFPWQLLGVAGLCLSLLGGSLIARDERLQSLPALAAIITLSVLASYMYLEPRGLDITPTHPPLARFGDAAYLVDVEITPTLKAGTMLTLTLLWQDIAPVADDYKVFAHVVDAHDKIWAQRDAQPLDGSRPTSSWQRGELLRDTYALAIPPDAPADLKIELGLYRADNGLRLKTATGDDRVIIKP